MKRKLYIGLAVLILAATIVSTIGIAEKSSFNGITMLENDPSAYKAWSQDMYPWHDMCPKGSTVAAWMNKNGCGIVAMSKLIVEAGLESAGVNFNPAVLMQAFIDSDHIGNNGFKSSNNDNLSAYVWMKEKYGFDNYKTSTTDIDALKSRVLELYDDSTYDYYIMLYLSYGHYVHVDKDSTLSTGKIVINNSYTSESGSYFKSASEYKTALMEVKNYGKLSTVIRYYAYGIEKTTSGNLISFDAQDGVCPVSHRKIESGSPLGVLPTPTRVGYSFAGWYSAASGGTMYTSSSICGGDMVLYAHWDILPCSCSTAYAGSYTVKGTSSGYLSINDGAGSSSNGYTQIGTIPEGTTIYISKATGYNGRGGSSGQWGEVTYNGVSGHCSMNYLEKITSAAISLDASGGSVSPAFIKATLGGPVGVLPTPIRYGYSFTGWFTAASGGTQYTASTVCTTSVTLYAQWSIHDACTCSSAYAGYYTVTGTSSGYLAINSGEGSASAGYTVLGSIPEGTAIYISKATGYNGRGKSSGQWGIVTYGGVTGHCSMNFLEKVTSATITFNANNGTVSPESKPAAIGSQVGTLPIPTRAGYTFAGWYTTAGGGSAYTSATICTGSVTLYAHWTADAKPCTCSTEYAGYYVVTGTKSGSLAINDGEGYGAGYTMLGEIPEGTTVYISKATGYNGRGSSANLWGVVTYNGITGHCAMNLLEKLGTYTITFNPNGGFCSTASVTPPQGMRIGDLPTPYREHYMFGGWFTGIADGEQYTSATLCMGSITLYARWYANPYTITFNSNGGGCAETSRTVYYGASLGELPVPSLERYNFTGWYDAAVDGTLVTSSTPCSGSMTLYAQWAVNVFTVSFDLNGGIGSADSITLNDGASIDSLPLPTRIGYEFTGWYTTSGTQVSNGYIITADQTLTAKWTSIDVPEYKLVFNANGGTVSPQYIECPNSSFVTDFPVPVRDGYIFLGWYTPEENPERCDSLWFGDSDASLDAHWLQIKNTITLPEQCHIIEADAFIDCSLFECLDLRNIEGSLRIEQDAFHNCVNLKAVLVDSSITELVLANEGNVFTNCPNVTVYSNGVHTASTVLYDHGIPVVYLPDAAKTSPVHAYKRFDSYQTWSDAQKYCESLNGHLATITSYDEQSYIDILMTATPRTLYFIGGTDADDEGTWRWVTGEPFRYAYWSSEQPDNWNGVEHCLTIFGSQYPNHKGFWNDSSNIGYISGDMSGYWKFFTQFGFIFEREY